ncbi:hypothetical protein ACOSQ3_022276 [Xanthoceras sorbifolium]
MRTLFLLSLVVVIFLFTTSGSKVAAAETGTCNFTPYPLPKCTSEICSKLCSADFGPSTEYECVNSKTCCCHAATN